VKFLKAGHDTQINLTFGTMILGFPTEYPAAIVYGVPAMIAAQSRALAQYWTMT